MVLSASSRSVYGIGSGSLDPSSIFNCVFPWDISILIGEPVPNHPLSTGRKDGGSDPKPAGGGELFRTDAELPLSRASQPLDAPSPVSCFVLLPPCVAIINKGYTSDLSQDDKASASDKVSVSLVKWLKRPHVFDQYRLSPI